MCGVAALVAAPERRWTVEQLDAMRRCLHHRGPDGSGLHTWPVDGATTGVVVGLAHTRLAIIDVSHDSDQPMVDPETFVAMTYNGEIYNYLELRRALEREGHRFRTSGDTEVLLRAYLAWGTSCFDRLIGMYAVVVHDPRTREVVAARDPYGIKPLYIATSPAGVALASELKAFRHLGSVDHTVSRGAVLRYLRFGTGPVGDSTLFAGVREVQPGTLVTIRTDTATTSTRRFYTFRTTDLSARDLSFDEAAQELRSRFLRSVELHSRSDVPIGTALSGGIDSSSIVGGLREVLGDGPPLHAFSYAAPDSSFDESSWAQLVADRKGAQLHRVAPSSHQFQDDLDDLVAAWDEPVPSTSVYAQYCIFRAARAAGVKVLLDGQGADEILGGYDRYVAARIATLVRRRRLTGAARLARAARTRGLGARATATMTADFLAPPRVQSLLRPLVGRPLMAPWLDPAWFAETDDGLVPAHYTRSRDVLRDQLASDLTTVGIPLLLRNEDRNSMIWSVESRVPFLVPDIAEFCVSLPEEYLVGDDATSKSVFKAAMRGIVPEAVLERTDKIGFEAPAARWFEAMGEAKRGQTWHEVTDTLPFIRRDQLEDLWTRARGERRAADAVWRIIFLTKWATSRSIDLPT